MKAAERERQDWTVVVLIILVVGFLCVIAAGQLALRFSPSWQLDTNMDSHLDPNSAFLTRRPNGFIEPVDASILTLPAWIDGFLTPGVAIVTGTPFPTQTRAFSTTSTTAPSLTNTVIATKSPTGTVVYIPPTRTATSKPGSTATSTSTRAPTSAVTNTSNPPATATFSSTMTVTYTYTATTTPTQTATATATATSTHTPVPIPTDSIPGEIGTTPDGVTYDLPAGGNLTLGMNIIANGDANYDLVYYEFPAASGILMDWVIIEISDGNNWYTIFNWGNNIADTNSNMNFNILSNPQDPPEQDQREIPSSELYNATGIAIDVDSIVPPGAYSYIRFSAPAGDVDGQMEIDAIEVLP